VIDLICKLCEKDIEPYEERFNHFVIDEDHAADICQECIDKFAKWQGKLIATLFPTKAFKRRYGDGTG
jgi:hypothetical protein